MGPQPSRPVIQRRIACPPRSPGWKRALVRAPISVRRVAALIGVRAIYGVAPIWVRSNLQEIRPPPHHVHVESKMPHCSAMFPTG